MKLLLSLSILTLLSSCGGDVTSEGENFGNLLESASGLVLTQDEHAGGWGRADCTTCHNLENIHLVDRTGTGLNIQATHNQAISEGNAGCPACHGLNGTP